MVEGTYIRKGFEAIGESEKEQQKKQRGDRQETRSRETKKMLYKVNFKWSIAGLNSEFSFS